MLPFSSLFLFKNDKSLSDKYGELIIIFFKNLGNL